jgi:Family of unknown function (DUF6920)
MAMALWLKLLLLIVVALLVIGTGNIAYGAWRWQRGTHTLRAQLQSARLPITPTAYDAREIEGLPAPVQRYFRAVLQAGQPMVAAVQLRHAGQFNTGETQAQWRGFTSSQVTITRRPGFDWDGRIGMGLGVRVFVHDAYVAGEGLLHAALLGLMPLADIRGTPEAAQGELMRFLAEAAWYPTALLPSQGVRWEAINSMAARATLTDGVTTVALDVHFDAAGLISSVRAAARSRMVHGTLVATPWQGRFWSYTVRDGIRIPLEGEVAWELPEGVWPYWRGRVTQIAYEFGP